MYNDNNQEENQFKYTQLYDWLKTYIVEEKFKYGDRLPSENMLSIKFKFSRQTVRNALKQLEEEGYVQRVKGSGTFVNKNVNSKNTFSNIGLLITYFDYYIFPTILSGAESILSKENIGIDFALSHNRFIYEKNFLQKILDSNIKGLIVEGIKSGLPNPNLELYKKLEERNIPIVFIHNCYQNFKSCSVMMNDQQCAYLMVKELVQNGHKKIAGIFKFDDMQGIERYKGYMQCLNEYSLELNDNAVKWYSAEDFSDANFEKLIAGFLKKITEYTAIICYNDILANMVVEILDNRNIKVPEDISVVSFDDSYLSKREGLKIVSAVHPKFDLGVAAAELMVEQLNEKKGFRKKYSKIFEAQISEGNSIKNLNSKNTYSWIKD